MLRRLRSLLPTPMVPPASQQSSNMPLSTASPAVVPMRGGLIQGVNYVTLPITFTGSGREYFRIWVVNLLLMLVTFGIYWPWAKARRQRYFWGNTVIAGEPLVFHGDARKMLRGQWLVGLLLLVYSKVGDSSPVAGLVALMLVALLWPLLFRASQQFRMANTSWRGLRFHFRGDVPGAYRAILPLFVPGVILTTLGVLAPRGEAEPSVLGEFVGPLALIVLLVSAVLLPRMLWNLKSYQHQHYALGGLQTGFRAPPDTFYRLTFKFLGMVLLAVVLVMGGTWLLARSLGPQLGMRYLWLLPPALLLVLALLAVSAWPWWQTRMQNLVWTETGSRQIRFISQLDFGQMLRLRLKNAALIVLTLGLYWPFAAVATARLRLQAVQVRSRADLGSLLNTARIAPGEGAGDAAGDFMGLDAGL